MYDTNRRWTRRKLLEVVGRTGGDSAVYETMVALGLINFTDPWDGPPKLPQGCGDGRRVLILGAGIGGLASALMLTRAGFRVLILEAQNRAGGRNFTARRGDIVTEESAEQGVTQQVCQFDDGLYINLGPGRIPYHHRRAIHFARELGVPLEVYVMEAMASLFQTDAGFMTRPEVRRRIAYDTQGHIAGLLAKAVNTGALDAELDETDRLILLDLLRVYGDLGEGTPEIFAYNGSTRTGCDALLTVFQPCLPPAPLPLKALLRSHFWRDRFYQPFEFEWQPTLFQPVGGMDQLVQGFLREIGDLIRYEAVVKKINLLADEVEVIVADGQAGKTHELRADICISNIPLPVLQKIDANFSPDFQQAVNRGRFANSCKVGWQANQRFWENNRNQIYGGISFTNDIITQIWYPSNDYFAEKGTLTGTYNFDEKAAAFGRLTPPERLVRARQGGAKLHPEMLDDAIIPLDKGISIAWQNVPFQRGAWADWNPDSTEDRVAYTRLLSPDGDGRFFIVGDQVSTLPGWQEGALMSAEHVVEQIAGLRPLSVPILLRVPHTRRLVQGRF